MKTLISAAVLAAVAATSVAANTDKGLVFRDGKAIGTIYEVMIADGKSDSEARMSVAKKYADDAAQRKADRDQEVRAKAKAEEDKEETKPIDPVDPVDPIDPVDPVDPIDPVDPVDPIDPVDPVDPDAGFEDEDLIIDA